MRKTIIYLTMFLVVVSLAFAASIIISAVIAQALSDQTDYLNTTHTTIVDYVIYFSVFSALLYLDNKKISY